MAFGESASLCFVLDTNLNRSDTEAVAPSKLVRSSSSRMALLIRCMQTPDGLGYFLIYEHMLWIESDHQEKFEFKLKNTHTYSYLKSGKIEWKLCKWGEYKLVILSRVLIVRVGQ